MADKFTVSGTDSPYKTQIYTPQSNDKNTLSITGYFKLMAAQLQYQDMNNPMDNSEMMAQMTQMAMVQSMSAMTESIENSTAINTSVYAAGLMGQDITVIITEEDATGADVPVDVEYGQVKAVDLSTNPPTILLDNGKKYPLSHVLGMGQLENPYKDKTEGADKDEKPGSGETDDTGKTEGTGGSGDSGKTEGTDGTGSVDESNGSDENDSVDGDGSVTGGTAENGESQGAGAATGSEETSGTTESGGSEEAGAVTGSGGSEEAGESGGTEDTGGESDAE